MEQPSHKEEVMTRSRGFVLGESGFLFDHTRISKQRSGQTSDIDLGEWDLNQPIWLAESIQNLYPSLWLEICSRPKQQR